MQNCQIISNTLLKFCKVVYISVDLMYNTLYIKSGLQMDLHKGA